MTWQRPQLSWQGQWLHRRRRRLGSLVVTTNGYPSFSGADFSCAVTSRTNATPTAWLTGTEPNTTAYNEAGRAFTRLYSIINAIATGRCIPAKSAVANATPTRLIPPALIIIRSHIDFPLPR